MLLYLQDSDFEENTIVVFTSDHGDMLGEHGRVNKGLPYKISAGTSFIIRYPGHIKARKIVQVPTQW